MPWSQKWERLNPFHRLLNRARIYGIRSSETFRAILERERARSDRNSHLFSLAVFDVGRNAARGEMTEHLARVLTSRIRFTDEVGWLGDTIIGVLLPETPAAGAWKFAEDVCGALADPGPPPACKVYTYPIEGLAHDRNSDDPRQLWFADFGPLESQSSVLRQLVEKLSVSSALPAASHRQASAAPAEGHEASAPAAAAAGIEKYLEVPPPLWKRSLDVIGALAGLILLSPLMLATALLIKIVSPGPVLFKQERVGYLGRTFTCWKFRTMKVAAEISSHQSHLQKLMSTEKPMTKLDQASDPRIIPLGRLLRYSGIDELPQLFNVLRGEMSLIGPRPCIPYEFREYHRWQRRRTNAIPGLTGLWQVSGKNRTTFNEMMRLDIAYTQRRSPWLDVLILFKTLPAISGQIRDGFIRRARRSAGSGVRPAGP